MRLAPRPSRGQCPSRPPYDPDPFYDNRLRNRPMLHPLLWAVTEQNVADEDGPALDGRQQYRGNGETVKVWAVEVACRPEHKLFAPFVVGWHPRPLFWLSSPLIVPGDDMLLEHPLALQHPISDARCQRQGVLAAKLPQDRRLSQLTHLAPPPTLRPSRLWKAIALGRHLYTAPPRAHRESPMSHAMSDATAR